MTCTVQLLRHDTYNYKRMTCATVQLRFKSGLLVTNQIREFCYSYDYDFNQYRISNIDWHTLEPFCPGLQLHSASFWFWNHEISIKFDQNKIMWSKLIVIGNDLRKKLEHISEFQVGNNPTSPITITGCWTIELQELLVSWMGYLGPFARCLTYGKGLTIETFIQCYIYVNQTVKECLNICNMIITMKGRPSEEQLKNIQSERMSISYWVGCPRKTLMLWFKFSFGAKC